jgi:hypothetical protein
MESLDRILPFGTPSRAMKAAHMVQLDPVSEA